MTLAKLNNEKAKVADARDKLKECHINVQNMNTQIEAFQKNWEEIRVKYFSFNLRGIISGYENAFLDTKMLLEELINYKYLLERQVSTPTLIKARASLIPENDAEDLKLRNSFSLTKNNESLQDKRVSKALGTENSIMDGISEGNDLAGPLSEKGRASYVEQPSFPMAQKG
jgi:hypothetical protein